MKKDEEKKPVEKPKRLSWGSEQNKAYYEKNKDAIRLKRRQKRAEKIRKMRESL